MMQRYEKEMKDKRTGIRVYKKRKSTLLSHFYS